jgi:hypothetical protein
MLGRNLIRNSKHLRIKNSNFKLDNIDITDSYPMIFNSKVSNVTLFVKQTNLNYTDLSNLYHLIDYKLKHINYISLTLDYTCNSKLYGFTMNDTINMKVVLKHVIDSKYNESIVSKLFLSTNTVSIYNRITLFRLYHYLYNLNEISVLTVKLKNNDGKLIDIDIYNKTDILYILKYLSNVNNE